MLGIVVGYGLELGCGEASTPVVEPYWYMYRGLLTPNCLERPEVDETPKSNQLHTCWRFGDALDLALSASCRVNRDRAVSCWKAGLRPTPSGRFVAITDDGYDACGIREDGKAVCWGGVGEERTNWSRVPNVELVAVSLGHSDSPYGPHRAAPVTREFACGVSRGHVIVCWENGVDGRQFVVPGKYKHAEAGAARVCGITLDGNLECWGPRGLSQGLQKEFTVAGPFKALSVGVNTACVLDHSGLGRCWGRNIARLDTPMQFSNVSQVRAGSGSVCVLRATGAVECVGDFRPPPSMKMKWLTEPSRSGGYCGISNHGSRYCWGDPR